MEGVIIHHMAQELSSPVPYMRWRSNLLYSQFETLTLQDQNHLHQVIDVVYKNLFDVFLPVRVESAVTLYKLLD
jgi:hypothetical protein